MANNFDYLIKKKHYENESKKEKRCTPTSFFLLRESIILRENDKIYAILIWSRGIEKRKKTLKKIYPIHIDSNAMESKFGEKKMEKLKTKLFH